MGWYIQSAWRKYMPTKNTWHSKLAFRNEGVATISTLQEMLKGIIWTELKGWYLIINNKTNILKHAGKGKYIVQFRLF